MNAESIKSIEDFNVSLERALPGVAFSKWYLLGSVVEDIKKEKRYLTNNTLPTGRTGVYVIGALIRDAIVFIYAGMAAGKTRQGIHNRINNHYRYSQNDRINKESGPLAGARALGLKPTFYASFYDCNDELVCDSIESYILDKYDFACNIAKKKIQKRRLDDLVKLMESPLVDEKHPLEPMIVKKTVIKKFVNLVCGCNKQYQLPVSVSSLACPCGAKFGFTT
jgi:hypothetical protein